MALEFSINGERVSIPVSDLDPGMTLNDFIRERTRFKGTKKACGEGGCGSCAVTLTHNSKGKDVIFAVNSCLKPLASMDGIAVTTVEGLSSCTAPSSSGALQVAKASVLNPLHPLTERFSARSSLQCGFCTPGMVMAAYAQLRNSVTGDTQSVTAAAMEECTDGNLCRCTGYRPILEACRSFATETRESAPPSCAYSDAGKELGVAVGPYLSTRFDPPFPSFLESHQAKLIACRHSPTGKVWFRPTCLQDAFAFWAANPEAVVVAGCTAWGVYKESSPFSATCVLDIQGIAELSACQTDSSGIVAGAGCTLSGLIELVQQHQQQCGPDSPSALHQPLIRHLKRVAGTLVRNTATIAGNLAITKQRGFASDLATLLVGLSAEVELVSQSGRRSMSVEAWLADGAAQTGELIGTVRLKLDSEAGEGRRRVFRSFRVALRRKNAHSYVNAAMAATVHTHGAGAFSDVVLAFGASTPLPQRARAAEQALESADPGAAGWEGSVLCALHADIAPQWPDRFHLRATAPTSFVLKFLAACLHGRVPPQDAGWVDSMKGVYGGVDRPLSTSVQNYSRPAGASTHVHQPVPKESNRALASGQAVFVDDVAVAQGALHGVFIGAPSANGTFRGLDVSRVTQAGGEAFVVDASHVPAMNGITTSFGPPPPVQEPIFLPPGSTIQYQAQPLALVCAPSAAAAKAAARLVRIDVEAAAEPPVTDITDAVQRGTELPQLFKEWAKGDAPAVMAELPAGAQVLKGAVTSDGMQKHLYMETQTSYACPEEEGGVELACSSQNQASVQEVVANALGVPLNMVRVRLRRMGGAFGGKATRQLPVAAAAAVAANALRRPVKVTLDRNTDMAMTGGRQQMLANFTVAFDADGKVLALEMQVRWNAGFNADLSMVSLVDFWKMWDSVYDIPNAKCEIRNYASNTPTTTAVRGPGVVEASHVIESIMEAIATELDVAPELVRERNMQNWSARAELPEDGAETAATIFEKLKTDSDFERRVQEAQHFNRESRWLKRGLSMVPIRYSCSHFGGAEVILQVCKDGTVVVHHHGSEMGQGIHIKAAQVAADTLNTLWDEEERADRIEMSMVRFAERDTFVLPRGVSAGSTTSELVCLGVQKAAEELVRRMRQVRTDPRAALGPSPTWKQIVAKALGCGVSPTVSTMAGSSTGPYAAFGACVSEVEVDAMTGEVAVRASHILYDCARSINPAVDIGQVEGAFVMGLGYWLCEDATTASDGTLLANGTWEYKVAGSADIPVDLRVDLLENANFSRGILGSKASGEPPLLLATSVWTAVRMAVQSARADCGLSAAFELEAPATPDRVLHACGTTPAVLSLSRGGALPAVTRVGKVAVLGAGVEGLMAAAALVARGVEGVEVFDARSRNELEQQALVDGGCIDAWNKLDEAVARTVKDLIGVLPGAVREVVVGGEGAVQTAVARQGRESVRGPGGALWRVLLTAVGEEKVQWGKRVLGMYENTSASRLYLAGGESLDVDLVVGADGPAGIVRRALRGVREGGKAERRAWSGMVQMQTLTREVDGEVVVRVPDDGASGAGLLRVVPARQADGAVFWCLEVEGSADVVWQKLATHAEGGWGSLVAAVQQQGMPADGERTWSPPAGRLVSSRKHALTLGSAAHGCWSGGGGDWGCAEAVEDAVALAEAVQLHGTSHQAVVQYELQRFKPPSVGSFA